ncbi:MAG: TadG family pilus assembly protein, partial [Egibacteraceae bacterium]
VFAGGFADTQAGAEQLALASAASNDFVPDGDRTLVTHVGRWDAETGSFSAGTVAANAVRVVASDTVGFTFMPGGRPISVTAVASTENIAGIAIGTGLASLDSKKSALIDPLLSGLLGTSLGLTAAHYNGIADLDVPIGVLATHLGVGAGGIDELLATEVSVKTLAQAFADANPDTIGLTADALGVIASLGTNQAQHNRFVLGEILTVASGFVTGDAAADAEVNALTMLMAAAQMANKNNAVTLDVGSFLPSLTGGDLASSTLRLVVIEAPDIAIGPARMDGGEWVTEAHSAQVRLAVNNSVNLTSALISPLLADAALQLPLYVGAAEGTAALTANRCGDPGQLTTDVHTEGVNLAIANPTDTQLINDTVPTGAVRLVGLRTLLLGNVADVYGRADVTVGASETAALDFTGPFDWDNTQHMAFSSDPKSALLADLHVYEQLLGLSLSSTLLSAITGTVANIKTLSNGLLSGLYDEVLDPALSLLGAELAGADVTAWHQECGPRVLVQ